MVGQVGQVAQAGQKRVVIVGAGFAGMNAARRLGRRRDLRITVVDRHNHHLFQPLLYQVAMAGLSPADIARPIRSLLSEFPAVRVIQGEVAHIDLAARRVSGDRTAARRTAPFEPLDYDYLVLATGAQHAYFGNEHWEPFAPGLKTLEQATEIRRRVLSAFERAERSTDTDERKRQLTFVIVGGGPTGVELAGAIGEVSRFTLARDFRTIDPKLTRVILVEAGERILPGFDPVMASRATRDLESLGVQVWTRSRVGDIDASGVQVGEERVAAATVLWAAGVRASALGAQLGVQLDRLQRVPVSEDLSLAGHPEVFVLGDMACVHDAAGQPLPGVAPVALQQGRHVGQLIADELDGKPRKPFRYRDKGQMATIGRSRAVVSAPGLRLTGWLAWVAWLLIHIYYLSGFRNRLLVLIQWAFSYVTFARGARLIVEKGWRSYPDALPPRSPPAPDTQADAQAPRADTPR